MAKRNLQRLRKKHLPFYEKMTQKEFEEWLEEEVVRRQRTELITSDLIGGIARVIRPIIMLTCKSYKVPEAFDDLLHDIIIKLAEKDTRQWNPFRGRVTYFLAFRALWGSIAFVRNYIPLDRDDPDLIEALPVDPQFIVEDFLHADLKSLPWAFDSNICVFIAMQVLVGVKRKRVITLLRKTFFKKSEDRPLAINVYEHVIALLRLELSSRMERYELVGDTETTLVG